MAVPSGGRAASAWQQSRLTMGPDDAGPEYGLGPRRACCEMWARSSSWTSPGRVLALLGLTIGDPYLAGLGGGRRDCHRNGAGRRFR